MIPLEQYLNITKLVPIVCVDIVIQNNTTNQFLLLYRTNDPLSGTWWVPGGRILKEENAIQACKRKLYEELSINCDAFNFLGYYEEIFNSDPIGSFTKYHTISLVFRTVISLNERIKLDSQHAKYDWFDVLPNELKIKN